MAVESATPPSYDGLLHADVQRFLASRPSMLIDGEAVAAVSGRTFEVEDPATGMTIAEVPAASSEDVDRAVAAAARALRGPWGRLPARERSAALNRIADLLEAEAEQLAQLEALDSGKPVANARSYDIPKTVEFFRYFAGWPTKIHGETIPGPGPDRLIYTLRQPVGVVGHVIPWNFPLMIGAWKLAPALAAGCTIVIKPAEQTPLSLLYAARLLAEADALPAGVVNVVTGDGPDVGAPLVAHPGIAKVSFTGSPEVAREIVRAGADTLKRITLELGGKSPNIVLPDVDLDEVARQAAGAAFLNQGENCIAGTRLFVHRSVFDDVVGRVADEAAAMRLGPGLLEETTMGPLISGEHRDRVRSFVAAGRDEGGTLHSGELPSHVADKGYFVAPTVITGLGDDARVTREEVFGPVLVALPFETLEEVAARANATEYGLAAGIWTRDIAAAHRLAQLLEAGTVWINAYNETDPAVPFGGWKQSGWGREHGAEVLSHYLETKSVWVNLDPVPSQEEQ